MTRSGLIALLLLTFVLPALATGPARADSGPPVAGADYGGGTPHGGVPLGFRVSGDASRATAYVNLVQSCHHGVEQFHLRLDVRLGPAGALKATRTARHHATTVHVTMTGALHDNTGAGRLTARYTYGGHRCAHSTQAWDVRRAGLAGADPGPQPPLRSFLYGTVTQPNVAPFQSPIYLLSNGHGFWADYYVVPECPLGYVAQNLAVVNLTPYLQLHPDGTFAGGDTFTVAYIDGRTIYHERVTGHWTQGGAVGQLRMQLDVRLKNGNRAHCDTGTVPWSAAL